jgi:hypothetical protein
MVHVQVLSFQVRVRVQVQVHRFQEQVPEMCTQVLLEYKYRYQVLQL